MAVAVRRGRGRPKGSKNKITVDLNEDISFKNNPRIKKVGIRFNLTPEQVQEYTRCVIDPIYFIEKYVKFITIDHGLVNIKLYDWQKDMVLSYHNDRRVIIKTGRQFGKTQCTVGFLLHYLLFNNDKTIGVLAQKQKTAIEILTRIKQAMEYIPLWMQQGVKSWNQTMIELENDSRIICESTSGGAIRGFTINLLYLDEFAHVPTHVAEPFMTSVYPTISSGQTSKIIITSTPLGLNLYYRLWIDAIKEKTDPNNWNGFKAISVHWTQVPGRTQQWADQQKKVLGPRAYAQDVEAEFLGSALTLISGDKLRTLTFVMPQESLLEQSLDVYERAANGHNYVISVDPSEGKQLDYSCFTVFDTTTVPYRVVAKYRNNMVDDMAFAAYVYQSAKHYNDAYLIVENNSIGALVCHHLMETYEYDNMFYSMTNVDNSELTAVGPGLSKVPGIRTTVKSKMQGCNRLKMLVENDQIVLNDFNIVSELSTFVLQKNKHYAAEDGYHDDCVATMWLFAWLVDQPFFKDFSDPNLRQRLIMEKERLAAEAMPPQVVLQGPFEKPQPKLEVRDGVVWIDASMGYDDALRILNSTDDY